MNNYAQNWIRLGSLPTRPREDPRRTRWTTMAVESFYNDCTFAENP